MRRRSSLGLLLLALCACDKPPIVDPAEVAYRHAMDLFAKACTDTHDLTYRDPRFDAVLEALALVPQGDELRAKADALVQQIKTARAEADRADAESNSQISQALEPPTFSPQERDAPFPVMGKAGAPAAGAGAARQVSSNFGYAGSASPPSAAARRAADSKLPEWYRRAGYLGYGKRPAAPGATGPTGQAAPPTGPPPPAAEAANTASGPAPNANLAPSSATPVVPQGPPPVFGLPGPAGRAIMGGH